jgi:hypothetical protein
MKSNDIKQNKRESKKKKKKKQRAQNNVVFFVAFVCDKYFRRVRRA